MNIGHILTGRLSPQGVALATVIAIVLIGCQGTPSATPTRAQSSPAPSTPAAPVADTVAPVPTSAPTPVATPTPVPAPSPTPLPTPTPTRPPEAVGAAVTIGPSSVARYRVREQFARVNLPNDAVGETSAISGQVVFDAGGRVVASRSKITVNAPTLTSDESDRDDCLRTQGLETDRFPQMELVVEDTPGLPWPLPMQGGATFQLRGSMTVHGVTSPTTWEVAARFSPDTVRGQARTRFPFGKFQMERPTAFFLLSVENDIRLEVDLVATVQPSN